MPDTSRALGFWETLQALVHDMLHGHANIGYMITVSGLIDKTLFLKGLESLFSSQPMLRACLSTDEKGLYYLSTGAKFEDIPKSFQQNCTQAQAKALYEEELYQEFDTRRFLWRAHLLHNPELNCSYLIGSFCHAIGDGLSILHFLQDLIASINQRGKLQNFTLLPAVEHMLDASRFKEQSQKVLAAKPAKGDLKKISWPFQAEDPGIENRRPGNIFKVMNAKQCKALQKICVQKSLTVNDALNAALILALGKLTTQKGSIDLYTPINLRKLCSPNIASGYFGCNITMAMTSHSIESSSENFWSIAESYHQNLREAVKTVGYNPKNFELSDILPYVKTCQEKREAFYMDFGISNMGNFDFGEKATDAHKVLSSYGASSRQGADFVSLISIITVKDKMFLTFPYTKPLIEDEWMEKLADYMLEILIFYSKGTSLKLTQAA